MASATFGSGTPPRSGMVLTFSENFDRNTLDGGPLWKTTYPGGLRTLKTTGEKQMYMDENYISPITRKPVPFDSHAIENGILTLKAIPTPGALLDDVRMPYMSAMINSYDAMQMRYGYVEATAEIPAGKGLWPAFWLRSVDPTHPVEIDIVEMLGQTPGSYNGTIHTPGHQYNVARVKLPDLSQGMHRFGVDWQHDFTTFYVDGKMMGRMATPDALDSPLYMIGNLAIGGWAGATDAKTPWPAEFEFDSIRVWQDKADLAPQTLTGSQGHDTMSGGDGNDVLRGNAGQDTIFGANGHDIIDGGRGADRVLGGFGNDTLTGSDGDFLMGGMGDDTYIIQTYGARPNEQSGQGFDTVKTSLSAYALIGNIEALAYTGNDSFRGIGNIENNVITGGDAGDWLAGGRGADRLEGRGGNDKLHGGSGNDTLISGTGNDMVSGGTGADRFVLNPGDGRDFITDFETAADKVDLRAFVANDLGDVLARTTTIKGNATVTLEGTTFIMQGITKGMLHADDFIFG